MLGLGDRLPYPGLGAVAAGHLAPGARDHLVAYALVRGLPIRHNTVHRSRPWRETRCSSIDFLVSSNRVPLWSNLGGSNGFNGLNLEEEDNLKIGQATCCCSNPWCFMVLQLEILDDT